MAFTKSKTLFNIKIITYEKHLHPISQLSASSDWGHNVLCYMLCRWWHDSGLTLEMPKRRDIVAIVLIVLPWTLLITVWHQSTITPLLATRKGNCTRVVTNDDTVNILICWHMQYIIAVFSKGACVIYHGDSFYVRSNLTAPSDELKHLVINTPCYISNMLMWTDFKLDVISLLHIYYIQLT